MYLLNGIPKHKLAEGSELVRLRGKYTEQSTHCALGSQWDSITWQNRQNIERGLCPPPYFGQCPKANILLQGKFPNMVSPWYSWVTMETSMPKANVIAPPALPVALSAPARPTFWSALLLSFSSYCQTYSIDSIDRPRQRRYEGSPQQCIKKGPLLCMEGSLITN